jgi:nucleoid-associated protein YgaU
MSKRSISPYERYGQAVPLTDSALRLHTYSATDTLSNLAEKYYDDWRKWRIIADRNQIKDPRRIKVGTVLIIPQLPLEKGEFE